MLRSRIARQQLVCYRRRTLRLLDHAADGIGDRHFNPAQTRTTLHFSRGEYALGNMSKAGLRLCNRLTTRERQTDPAIARQVAGASQQQIADAGQPHEGFRAPAQRHAKPCHFREATGHQRRACIKSEPQSIANARCNRNDILDRAADFDADHIIM